MVRVWGGVKWVGDLSGEGEGFDWGERGLGLWVGGKEGKEEDNKEGVCFDGVDVSLS